MDIDAIRISFDEGSLTTLRIVLALILLGVALDTRVEDFRRAVRHPFAILVVVIAQFLVLPAITFALTLALDLRESLALGLILVACCPPGNVSNILTHRAGGDVAMSVSMTAVGNVLAIFLMPLNLAFWGGLHPSAQHLMREIALDPWDMLVEILLVIGIPFVIGLTVTHFWPRLADRARRIVGPVAFLGLVGVIAVGISNNWDLFLQYIGLVVVAVFLHDALALALGYAMGRATRLDRGSVKASTFETGIRNAGLGLLLVFTFFDGLGGMALVAAWWGIWDIIAGLVVAWVWRRRTGVTVAREGHDDGRPPRSGGSPEASVARGGERA